MIIAIIATLNQKMCHMLEIHTLHLYDSSVNSHATYTTVALSRTIQHVNDQSVSHPFFFDNVTTQNHMKSKFATYPASNLGT